MKAPKVVTIGYEESALDRRERLLAEREAREEVRREQEKVHPLTEMFSQFFENQGS